MADLLAQQAQPAQRADAANVSRNAWDNTSRKTLNQLLVVSAFQPLNVAVLFGCAIELAWTL